MKLNFYAASQTGKQFSTTSLIFLYCFSTSYTTRKLTFSLNIYLPLSYSDINIAEIHHKFSVPILTS